MMKTQLHLHFIGAKEGRGDEDEDTLLDELVAQANREGLFDLSRMVKDVRDN